MKQLFAIIEQIGSNVLLFLRTMTHIGSLPRQYGRLIEQSFFIGYTTLPIIAILSVFIGAVLALQSGFTMRNTPGAQNFLGAIVGLSMCRELGPVMASFLLAGRVGSAITAELASMKVYSEVDALTTMNIPPERILVLPRLIATALMMPVLAVFSIVIGWYGGAIVIERLDFITIDAETYWANLKVFVKYSSVLDGIIKAELFGILVTLICCHEGLRTRGGPREIGRAVTRGVVLSMVVILFLDYFVTKLLL